MRRRALALLLLALLPLAACGDDDDDGDDAAETTSTTAADTSSTTTTDGTEPSETTATTEEPAAASAVVPGTHGVDVSAEGSGSSFAFGSTDEVVDAITDVLGDPTDESDIPECPAGPASGVRWGEELQVVQQEGAFVGWSMGAGSTLILSDGLAIGSTLQDVRDRYPDVIVIPDSTIGIELYAESVGLSGLVTEDSPEGAVTSLWAGTVCIFR